MSHSALSIYIIFILHNEANAGIYIFPNTSASSFCLWRKAFAFINFGVCLASRQRQYFVHLDYY